jgi:hypothetical protein
VFTSDILFGMNILSLAGFAEIGLSITLLRLGVQYPMGTARSWSYGRGASAGPQRNRLSGGVGQGVVDFVLLSEVQSQNCV